MAQRDTSAYERGHEIGSRMSPLEAGEFLEGFVRALGTTMTNETHGPSHMMSVPLDVLAQLIVVARRLQLRRAHAPMPQQGDASSAMQEG